MAAAWPSDSVVILCGRTTEHWSPCELGRGMGGSEEAVIYLARELRALGRPVTVFGNPGPNAGEYNGVAFRDHSEFGGDDQFDTLIVWRDVRRFDRSYDCHRAYLWLHDVPDPSDYTPSRLGNLSKVFVLSEFHRAQLPHVAETQICLTRNGIVVDEVERVARGGIERLPHRCIYASSYERGLTTLLLLWPDVRRAVPDAELHVFYGWSQFFINAAGDPSAEKWREVIERLFQQPGVVHHGRVGQRTILEETFRSALWAYPTSFPEVSCITAMKCQAAGAIPVVSNFAALQETVQHGRKLGVGPDMAISSPEMRAEFAALLVEGLRDTVWQAAVRSEMMAWAREYFSWSTVARQWDREFRTV